jgi:hypothetical protein
VSTELPDFLGINWFGGADIIFLSTLPEKRLQMYFDDLQASQNLAWS